MKKQTIGVLIAVLAIGSILVTALLSSTTASHATATTTTTDPQTRLATATKPTVDVFASRDNRAWGSVYLYNPQTNDYQAMTQSTGGHLVDYQAIPPLEQDANYQKWRKVFGDDGSFSTNDGKEIYHQSCAGCHLHEGQGGRGAGYYPPLANNPKMRSSQYVYSVLINGLRGMPYFRDMLNDKQMAAVTKYIQEDLNGIKSTANAKEVTALRHETSPAIDPSDH